MSVNTRPKVQTPVEKPATEADNEAGVDLNDLLVANYLSHRGDLGDNMIDKVLTHPITII